MNLENKPEEAPEDGLPTGATAAFPPDLPAASWNTARARDGMQPEAPEGLGLCLLLVPKPTQLETCMEAKLHLRNVQPGPKSQTAASLGVRAVQTGA